MELPSEKALNAELESHGFNSPSLALLDYYFLSRS